MHKVPFLLALVVAGCGGIDDSSETREAIVQQAPEAMLQTGCCQVTDGFIRTCYDIDSTATCITPDPPFNVYYKPGRTCVMTHCIEH